MKYPCSPNQEIGGLLYFPRLTEKIRLHDSGELHPELHANLGKGMDLWTCQFLGVDYQELKKDILGGANDEDALALAREKGSARDENETAWWNSFMRNVGFRDKLSETLAARKKESPETERPEIQTMFDYLDADEGRA